MTNKNACWVFLILMTCWSACATWRGMNRSDSDYAGASSDPGGRYTKLPMLCSPDPACAHSRWQGTDGRRRRCQSSYSFRAATVRNISTFRCTIELHGGQAGAKLPQHETSPVGIERPHRTGQGALRQTAWSDRQSGTSRSCVLLQRQRAGGDHRATDLGGIKRRHSHQGSSGIVSEPPPPFVGVGSGIDAQQDQLRKVRRLEVRRGGATSKTCWPFLRLAENPRHHRSLATLDVCRALVPCEPPTRLRCWKSQPSASKFGIKSGRLRMYANSGRDGEVADRSDGQSPHAAIGAIGLRTQFLSTADGRSLR